MKRGTSPTVRLDVVGLDPRIFEICKADNRAVVQSRVKEQRLASSETSTVETPSPELASVPKDQLAIYYKIVAITIDFERAYGRNVIVRIFERSSNKLFNAMLRRSEIPGPLNPVFYVNGMKVFAGVPNSFSALDEAIDNSFGRKEHNRF